MAEWLSHPWIENAINSFYDKNATLPKMAKAQIIKFNRAQTCEDRTAEAVISDKWMYSKALFTCGSIDNFERSMVNQDQLSLMDIKGGLIFLNDYEIKPHVNYSKGIWEHLIIVKDFSFKGSQKSPQFGGDLMNSAAYSPFLVKIKRHFKLRQIKQLLQLNQDSSKNNKCMDVKAVECCVVKRHQFVIVPQDQEKLLDAIPGWSDASHQGSLGTSMSTSMSFPQQMSSLSASDSEARISRNDIKDLVAQCQQVPSFTDSMLECEQECSKESSPKSNKNDSHPSISQTHYSNKNIENATSCNNHQTTFPHEMQEYVTDLSLLEQLEQQSFKNYKQGKHIVLDIVDETNDVAQRTPDQGMNDVAQRIPDQGMNDVVQRTLDQGMNDVVQRTPDQGMNDAVQRTLDQGMNDAVQRTFDQELNDIDQRTFDQDNNITAPNDWDSKTTGAQIVETTVFNDDDCCPKGFTSQHVLGHTDHVKQSAGGSLATNESNSHSEGTSSTSAGHKSDESYSILHDVSISDLVPGAFIPEYTSTGKESATSNTSDRLTDDIIPKTSSIKRVSFSESFLADEVLSDSDDSIVHCTQADDFEPRLIRDPLQLQGSVLPLNSKDTNLMPNSNNRQCNCAQKDIQEYSSLVKPSVIKQQEGHSYSKRSSVLMSKANSKVGEEEKCIKKSSSCVRASLPSQNNDISMQTTDTGRKVSLKPDADDDIYSCTFTPDKKIVMNNEESQESNQSPAAVALDDIIRCIEVYEENPGDGKVLLVLDGNKLSPKNSKTRSPVSMATTKVKKYNDEEMPSDIPGKDSVNSRLHSTSPVRCKSSLSTKEKNDKVLTVHECKITEKHSINGEPTLQNKQSSLNVQRNRSSKTSAKTGAPCQNVDNKESCSRRTTVEPLHTTKGDSSFDVSISDSLLARQVFTQDGRSSDRSFSLLHKSKCSGDGFPNEPTNRRNSPNNSRLQTEIEEFDRQEELPSLRTTNARPSLENTEQNISSNTSSIPKINKGNSLTKTSPRLKSPERNMQQSTQNEQIGMKNEPMKVSSRKESPSLGVNPTKNVIANFERKNVDSNSLINTGPSKSYYKSNAVSQEKNVVVQTNDGKAIPDSSTTKQLARIETSGCSLRKDSKQKEDPNKILPASSRKRLLRLSGEQIAVQEEEKENSPDDLRDSCDKSPTDKHCSIDVGQFYPKTSPWKHRKRRGSVVNSFLVPNHVVTSNSSSVEWDSSVMLNWLGLSRQKGQSTKRKRSQEECSSVKKANDGKIGWDMYSQQEPLVLDDSSSDEMISQDINPNSPASPVLIPSPRSPSSEKQNKQEHHWSNSRHDEETVSPVGSLRESLKSCSMDSRRSEEPCISLTLPSYQVPKSSNNKKLATKSKTSKQKVHIMAFDSDDEQDGFCWFTTKSWDGR